MVTIYGTFKDGAGTPNTGRLVFQLAEQATDGTVIFTDAPIAVLLDPTGSFTADLEATDALTSDGNLYEVREKLNGVEPRVYWIELPGPGPWNLADLSPFNSAPDVVYLPGPTPAGIVAPVWTPAAALVSKLRTGVTPVGVLCQGDSTSDEQSEWFNILTTWLASKFPAVSASYHLWNDATQLYDAPLTIQTGTAGDRSLTNADTTTYLTTPDSVPLSPAGDIDVQVKVALADWTPASFICLAGKWGTGGTRSWRLEVNSTGYLVLGTTGNGTTVRDSTSTVPVPFADGATGWVRATLDVDNGAAGNTTTFYTSTDGNTWTPLGAPVVVGGVIALFDSSNVTQLIGRGPTAGNSLPGTYYHFRFYSGLGGSAVRLINLDLDAMPAGGPDGTATFTDYTGNVWTTNLGTGVAAGSVGLAIFNGSTGGQVVGYSSNGPRFTAQTPYPCDLAFVSYSHNEQTLTGYRPNMKALTDLLVAKWPDVGVVLTSQNPRQTPAPYIVEHGIRAGILAAFAASQRFAYVDVFAAFGGIAATLTTAPGIHPNDDGSQVWANEAKKLFTTVA